MNNKLLLSLSRSSFRINKCYLFLIHVHNLRSRKRINIDVNLVGSRSVLVV